MKLALALTVAVAGCAAPAVDGSLVSAPGEKRLAAAGVSRHHLSGKARPRRSFFPSAASRSLSRPAIAHDWTAVGRCESGGDPHADTGNGYYGLLQEDLSFWRNYGGLRFAPRPDLATEVEQIVVAERGLAVQGVGAWTVCGRFLRDAA